ncbi:uncharacterized protein HNP49_001119 [Pseudomonas fluvialis]|uniref:DUF1311 domain-containing protein n=1 Tax=Pseudomonas fluvialis TaxID=1793966 RepID=A0A7X0BQG6_9PSED|nr:lysozyme inhibitor LprI family protein [Pseudomonas fluvialis]MBB6340962.1 uncharacterized protein [Pseudomonas fluvialis]
MSKSHLHFALLCAALLPGLPVLAASPSFDCSKVDKGSTEELVCQSPELTDLDLKLADAYKAASKKAVNQHPNLLKAEQRGWIKGRDECWKSEDRNACVADSYRQRTAELQARYQLIAGKGPVHYACDGSPAKEVIATFYPTEPKTVLVEFGDSSSLMFLQPSGNGSQYLGRNETLTEGQDVTTVVWGYEAPEMKCVPR